MSQLAIFLLTEKYDFTSAMFIQIDKIDNLESPRRRNGFNSAQVRVSQWKMTNIIHDYGGFKLHEQPFMVFSMFPRVHQLSFTEYKG